MLHTLDLRFLQTEETIAAFLYETAAGPVLFECGPHSVFPALKSELKKYGYAPADLQALFLTHIHFDHAGAAWALAQEGVRVYVHPRGYKHLQDPSRLYASAQRIYGDKMQTLWGDMKSIEPDLLHPTEHNEIITVGDTKITALHTPGHAVHHIAWRVGDEIIAGDVAGVKIDGGPVVPPCPPPDIDLEAWENSIDLLLQSNIKALHLTHFGKITAVEKHLTDLRGILWNWANFIKPHYDKGTQAEEIIPAFSAYTEQQLRDAGADDALVQKYAYANPAWMSVAGLLRYWSKRLTVDG